MDAGRRMILRLFAENSVILRNGEQIRRRQMAPPWNLTFYLFFIVDKRRGLDIFLKPHIFHSFCTGFFDLPGVLDVAGAPLRGRVL